MKASVNNTLKNSVNARLNQHDKELTIKNQENTKTPKHSANLFRAISVTTVASLWPTAITGFRATVTTFIIIVFGRGLRGRLGRRLVRVGFVRFV